MPTTNQPRVFLSYARRDGESFASGLRSRLAALEPEITVWQDRSGLEGGAGWWNQIEAALDRAKFMIAVITPTAARSEVTRQEWRYARRRGVIVYPVKGVPDGQLDYAALPGWMRKVHFFDLGRFEDGEWRDAKEWDTFVHYLKSDRQAVRVPFMAPDLSAGFVAREDEYRQLLDLILDPSRANPVAITTALHGAGGYGKTTLAIALCHDPRVIEAFDDGILWASLGQTPNLLLELVKLYDALTGEQPGFLDVPQASAKLRDKLGQRNCLIVIDDAWDKAHAEPFLHAGLGCARVVTTRLSDLLAGAARVKVDEMSPEQSRRLIATGFGRDVPAADALDSLAGCLGEWPLLLRLAAAMVRRRLDVGDSTAGALTYVHRALDKRGVTAFDRADRGQRDEAVARTLAASLDQLSGADRVRLLDLAIFPEDADVPLTTVARAWDLDDIDTEECAQRLHDASLISLSLLIGAVKLHDVMRGYLLREIGDPAAAHARLVRSYGELTRLPDPYAWRWLSYHLAAAGEHERLRTLLLDVEWLLTKLAAAGVEALLADFERAPRDADLEILGDAIRLSTYILTRHPDHAAAQLLGRIPAGVSDRLDRLRAEAIGRMPGPALRPLWPSLIAPGATLLRTLTCPGLWVEGVVELPGDRILVWGEPKRQGRDDVLWLWSPAMGDSRGLGWSDAIFGVALLPADRAVSWGDALQVWDLATGNRRVIARWEADGSLVIYDEAGGVREEDATGYRRSIRGGATLSNGSLLCWGAGWLGVWNLTTGERRLIATDMYYGPVVTGDSSLFWAGGGGDPDPRCPVLEPGMHVVDLTGDAIRIETAAAGTTPDGYQSFELADGRVVFLVRAGIQIWNHGSGSSDLQTIITAPGYATNNWSWSEDAALGGSRILARVWDRGRCTTQIVDVASGVIQSLIPDVELTCALTLPGGHLMSWSGDGTVRLSDLSTGEPRVGAWFTLTTDTRPATGAIALSSGQVLSWAVDGAFREWTGSTLRHWSVATSGHRESTAHAGPVSGLVVLNDGDAVSWALPENTPWLRDRNRSLARPLSGHPTAVRGAAILTDESLLSWSEDGSLRRWDVASREARALSGHGLRVNGAIELRDGRVISFSEDNTLIVHDSAGGGRVLTGHWRGVNGALEMSDGSLLSWSDDYTIRLWNLTTGESREFGRTYAEVRGAIQVAEAEVVVWDAKGELRWWDLVSGHSRVWAERDGGPWRGALGLDAERVVSWREALWVWDRVTGEGRVWTEQRDVMDASVLPGGTLVSWGGQDPAIWLRSVETGEERLLIGHGAGVRGVVSVRAGRIASWSADESVAIWDVGAGRLIARFYFDAVPTVVRAGREDDLVVGDAAGRVHFLEGAGFEP